MVNRGGVRPAFARLRALAMLALVAAAGALLLRHDASTPVSSASPVSASSQVHSAFAHLPMSFEPNRGQAAAQVQFLAHGEGYGIYLLRAEAALTLPKRASSGSQPATVEMKLVGANQDAQVAGSDPLPGHSNYFIGNDPSRWLHNIPQFSRVQYRGVYPGIDLAFYGNQDRLEYDFAVSPGNDPRQIQLQFKGASAISIADDGDLVLGVNDRELRFAPPRIYQQTAAGVRTVAGSFAMRGENSVGFEIGDYDGSRTLIIDPVLTFSSYLGGTGDESCTAIIQATAGFVPHCPSIAVDSSNQRIYVAGATTSTGTFSGATPNTTSGPGGENIFVSRISLGTSGGVTTASLDFVTYIGGTGTQYPVGIGLDNGFNVYFAGTTNAPDYPTTPSAFQATPVSTGNNHAVVTEVDHTGSGLDYSTYLSGDGIDTASNMALDSLGRVYVIGTTTSTNFPTTVGALQPSSNATNQFFFSKINTSLNTINSLQYSTYIGGATPANGLVTGGAVAVDSTFNVYLAGGTSFTDLSTPNPWIVNAYQATPAAGLNVWVAKLNAPANNTQQYTISYGTYFGGSGDDIAYGVASDGTATYVTGSTTSSDITVPTTTLPYESTPGGGTDAFVAKFGVPAVSGTTQGAVPLDYFSYLGGGGQDVGLAIVADKLGNARLTGLTASSDLCAKSASGTCDAPFPNFNGATDAFIGRLNTVGTSTSTNTSTVSYLGGGATDIGTGIALDSSLNTYLAGETSSGNFPVAAPLSGGNVISGGTDAFVTELGPNTAQLSMPSPTPASALPACDAANPTVSPSPAGVGSQITFTYYIYNTGDPVAGVVFTDNLGTNSGTATASQGSCSAASNGSLTCDLGTVNTSTVSTLSTANSCGSTTSTNFAAKVTVTVTAPSTALQGQGSLGNTGTLSFPGGTLPSISGTVPLNDFTVSASAVGSTTIPSGGKASYSVMVTPTGAGFPESVTLGCGSGLPAGSTCTFTNNPIPNMSSGAQSRALAISTTARVTTTARLFGRGPFLGLWLPLLGFSLMGTGVSRKRRMWLAIFFGLLIATVLFQAGCSSTSTTRTTTGTPAGTYNVTVNATSGSATRTTTVQFTVE